MKYVRRFCVLASLIVALSSSSFAGNSWSAIASSSPPPSSTSDISPETTVTVVNILVNLLYLS